jgi:hypothetical protein
MFESRMAHRRLRIADFVPRIEHGITRILNNPAAKAPGQIFNRRIAQINADAEKRIATNRAVTGGKF